METTLLKGRKPTMEELYIHIHCERENGVSPVVAQISTDEEGVEGVSEIVENSDGNGGMNPTADGTSGQVRELDINSLKFTNKKKEQVFVSTNLITILLFFFYGTVVGNEYQPKFG